MSYQVRSEPGSVSVLHTALAATYDPATQGAIHVIDFDEDCLLQSQATSNVIPYTQPMFEQDGRVYVAAAAWRRGCAAAAWLAAPRRASLGRQDFVLLSGLACGAGAACPDFSASAARLRFGFVSGVDLPAGAAAGTVTQGVDNWQVTVWRR